MDERRDAECRVAGCLGTRGEGVGLFFALLTVADKKLKKNL